jgi:hypothetical protein
MCGALDELGDRGQILSNMDSILAFHKHVVKDNHMQDSLFGGLDTTSFVMKAGPPSIARAEIAMGKGTAWTIRFRVPA